MKYIQWGPLISAVALVMTSCGDTDSGQDGSMDGVDGGQLTPLCQSVVDALLACDLQPTAALECPSSPTDFEECVAQCLSEASCSGLRNEFCPNRPRRSRCEDTCGPQFDCGNGQVPLPEDFHCDGADDCLNGADEADCPAGSLRTCADGVRLKREAFCDGITTCFDESDEVGCEPSEVFDCGDGTYTNPVRVCDGNADCLDTSRDETQCPTPVICN